MCYKCITNCSLFVFFKNLPPPNKHSLILSTAPNNPAAPPPRRAERGFPLPLWRGVNSLANLSRTVAWLSEE